MRGAFEAMVAGKLGCTIECNPLFGPQHFDAVESIRSGRPLPECTATEAEVFEQASAAAVLATRKY